MLRRSRRWIWLGVLAGLLVTRTEIRGQTFDQASLSREDRNRQLDELAREVAALEKQGMLLRRLARLTTPSVVHIDAEKSMGRSSRRPLEEAGSGVIIEIDAHDYVITNRHVVDDAPLGSVKIKLSDGRILHPTRKWDDQETDIAVLAVTAPNLVTARIGDSDAVDIGDFVLAVGSPFGLSHSVTFGIISAKGRRDLDLGDGNIKYQDFFQTDAAINPGNSGGPLLNLRGEVIGINTAIASSSGGSEGIGFTIPINMVATVATQFIRYGRLTRAYLGVGLEDDFTLDRAIRLGLPQARGALIKKITPNSPAALAGLRNDDVVLEFNGHLIEDDEHLITIVGFTAIGKEVSVTVFRDSKRIPLRVTVGNKSDYPDP
ncbi:MAG: S1C family serine protease [Pirellulaceae bacterium]